MTISIKKRDAVSINNSLAAAEPNFGSFGNSLTLTNSSNEAGELLNLTGRKNVLDNSSFSVWQRGTSLAHAPNSDGFKADRWYHDFDNTPGATTPAVTVSQSNDVPGPGFMTSMDITVNQTGDLTTGQNYKFLQAIEKQRLAPLGWGTNSPQYATLSFYVKTNNPGSYGVSFSIPTSPYSNNTNTTYWLYRRFSVNSANQWERVTVTIPPPIRDLSGIGMTDGALRVMFQLDGHVDQSWTDAIETKGWESATTAWRPLAGNYLLKRVNNYFRITGVQLERGMQATPYEHRSLDDELDTCYRYQAPLQPQYGTLAINRTSQLTLVNVVFPRIMRASPSIDLNAYVNFLAYYDGAGPTLSSYNGPANTTTTGTGILVSGSGNSNGTVSFVHNNVSLGWARAELG